MTSVSVHALRCLRQINAWLGTHLQHYRARTRLRRELRLMEERHFHDIGRQRLDLEREAKKPFWRP